MENCVLGSNTQRFVVSCGVLEIQHLHIGIIPISSTLVFLLYH